jgi:hypothetical protein
MSGLTDPLLQAKPIIFVVHSLGGIVVKEVSSKVLSRISATSKCRHSKELND